MLKRFERPPACRYPIPRRFSGRAVACALEAPWKHPPKEHLRRLPFIEATSAPPGSKRGKPAYRHQNLCFSPPQFIAKALACILRSNRQPGQYDCDRSHSGNCTSRPHARTMDTLLPTTSAQARRFSQANGKRTTKLVRPKADRPKQGFLRWLFGTVAR